MKNWKRITQLLTIFLFLFPSQVSARFLAVDPVRAVDQNGTINQQILTDPQRLNFYAYGLNNPYRYVDPDGLSPRDKDNDGNDDSQDFSFDAPPKVHSIDAGRIELVDGSSGGGLNGLKKVVPNPKSVRQFGHTFSVHGAGAKNTEKLKGRATGTGKDQGQWLNNKKAALFLSQHSDMKKPSVVNIPQGLGQVIKPDGRIVPATKAQLVPKPGEGFRSAFPIE